MGKKKNAFSLSPPKPSKNAGPPSPAPPLPAAAAVTAAAAAAAPVHAQTDAKSKQRATPVIEDLDDYDELDDSEDDDHFDTNNDDDNGKRPLREPPQTDTRRVSSISMQQENNKTTAVPDFLRDAYISRAQRREKPPLPTLSLPTAAKQQQQQGSMTTGASSPLQTPLTAQTFVSAASSLPTQAQFANASSAAPPSSLAAAVTAAPPKVDLLQLIKKVSSASSLPSPSVIDSAPSFATPLVARPDDTLSMTSSIDSAPLVQHVPVRQSTAEHIASLPSFLRSPTLASTFKQATSTNSSSSNNNSNNQPKSILSPALGAGTPRNASRQVSVHFDEKILPEVDSLPSLDALFLPSQTTTKSDEATQENKPETLPETSLLSSVPPIRYQPSNKKAASATATTAARITSDTEEESEQRSDGADSVAQRLAALIETVTDLQTLMTDRIPAPQATKLPHDQDVQQEQAQEQERREKDATRQAQEEIESRQREERERRDTLRAEQQETLFERFADRIQQDMVASLQPLRDSAAVLAEDVNVALRQDIAQLGDASRTASANVVEHLTQSAQTMRQHVEEQGQGQAALLQQATQELLTPMATLQTAFAQISLRIEATQKEHQKTLATRIEELVEEKKDLASRLQFKEQEMQVLKRTSEEKTEKLRAIIDEERCSHLASLTTWHASNAETSEGREPPAVLEMIKEIAQDRARLDARHQSLEEMSSRQQQAQRDVAAAKAALLVDRDDITRQQEALELGKQALAADRKRLQQDREQLHRLRLSLEEKEGRIQTAAADLLAKREDLLKENRDLKKRQQSIETMLSTINSTRDEVFLAQEDVSRSKQQLLADRVAFSKALQRRYKATGEYGTDADVHPTTYDRSRVTFAEASVAPPHQPHPTTGPGQARFLEITQMAHRRKLAMLSSQLEHDEKDLTQQETFLASSAIAVDS